MKESRKGFYRRGRGKSFHAEGLKTEKEREPAVESLVRGIWRLRVSSRAESTGGCVKLKTVTDIRRSSVRNLFISREC